MRQLFVFIASICAAEAAQNDYYLHFNANNNGPVAITAGAPNANPLVPPPGACGMRFQKTAGPESDDLPIPTEWILPFDSPGPGIPDGAFDAYLGLPNCGWTGLTIDPENGGLIGPPGGLAGTLAIYEVYGYWVDSNGNKLVYKNAPCLPGCASAVGLKSWSLAASQLKATKLMLTGTTGIRSAGLLFTVGERSLAQLARDLASAVARRRTFVAGALENPIRATEDEALRRLGAAAAQQRQCRTLYTSGDMKSAAIACDAALSSVSLARAALEVSVEWMR